MKTLCYKFVTLFCALFVCSFAYAQTVRIDGWDVTYLGKSAVGSNAKFSYRACHRSGQGPLKKFTIGVPNCYPPFVIVDTDPNASVTPTWDDSNGVYGIVYTLQPALASGCKDFSYTVSGSISNADVGTVTIGVTDLDDSGDCSDLCGAGGYLPGPKCIPGRCPTTGSSACDASYSYADVVMMQDGTRCDFADHTLSELKNNDPRRDSQKTALNTFVTSMDALPLGARMGIASYNWGNHAKCDTQPWKPWMNQVDYWAYSRFMSLEDGSGGFDYDGFLHQVYNPHTYRAIDNGIEWTCGDAALDATMAVAHNHFLTSWADPQTPNYVVLISSGRPNRWSSNGGGSCGAANDCDCATAKNYAASLASQAKANGTKIFTVFLNDPTCGCSSTAVNAGKSFLRDQIATNSSYYYEATNANLTSVLGQIKDRLTSVAACSSGEQCVSGCCATPTPQVTVTPTRTPTRTPTPTPTVTKTPPPFSCQVGDGSGQININANCDQTTATVTLAATVSGTASGLTKTWSSNCPNARITVISNDLATLTFSINPRTPTVCQATYSLSKGAQSNLCATNIRVTPLCGPACNTQDIRDIQLAVDTQAHNINQMVKQAGRLLQTVAKTKDARTKRRLTANAQNAVALGESLYRTLWITIWTRISGIVTTCTPACSSISTLAQRTTIQASSNQLVQTGNNLLKTVSRNTKTKKFLNKSKTIKRKLTAFARAETAAISTIPLENQVCS